MESEYVKEKDSSIRSVRVFKMKTDSNIKNCSFHPDEQSLAKVSLGKADVTEAMIVEAHLNFCAQCHNRFYEIQRELMMEFNSLETNETNHEGDDDPLLAMLNASIGSQEGMVPLKTTDPVHSFLPEVLKESDDLITTMKWNSFWPSKGRVSLIASDRTGQHQLYFGIIDPGASLPGHKHSWEEQTLVLKGQYIVGGQVFEVGDWSQSKAGEEHAPSAGKEEHCYCLIRVKKNGFHFTGNSRWRNMFLNVFN